MTFPSDADTTTDEFLNGAVRLRQPRVGYRAGVDPVLLAAAVPAQPKDSVLDLGCGAGAALFCLASRVPGLSLTGVEVQDSYAALARENSALNGQTARIVTADIAALPADLRNTSFHHVLMNPPYFDRDTGTGSRDAGRDTAFGGQTPLALWLDIGARRVRAKGTLTVVQRIERLPDVLGALGGGMGSIIVRPIAAREGQPATRFLLQARKGGRARFQMSAPLVLHTGAHHIRDGDDYTDRVRDILRNGHPLPLGD